MARNYATFATSVWQRGDDFLALTDNAQRVYFMLATQPDISAVGMLSLNVRRWAGRSADGTKEKVISGLQELAAHRYIAYDHDTEELLIRTFVKWDGGYANRKRKPVIERSAKEVDSATLREILAEELAKVGLPGEWASDGYLDAHRSLPNADDNEALKETDESESSQVDSLSRAACRGTSRSDGVVVTKALVVDPHPSTRIPQPVPPPAADADASAIAAEQATLDGMPEAPKPVETDEQRGFRLARAWIKTCSEKRIPVTQRGKVEPAVLLQKVITPILAAGCTEAEVTKALERLGRAVPSADAFDVAIARIRAEDDLNRQSGPKKNNGAGYQSNKHKPFMNPTNEDAYEGVL